jgi:hypothetical protein
MTGTTYFRPLFFLSLFSKHIHFSIPQASLKKKRKSSVHCKKRFVIFPSPAGMSLTKLSLAGNNWQSLVSDIPAEDGKTANSFFTVWVWGWSHLQP